MACAEALAAQEEQELAQYEGSGEPPEPVEFPEGGEGYCGCETCVVREVLTGAWPHLRLAARAEFADELETELQKIWHGAT